MKTIKNYYDLYLKCDVLLLADAFEKFRNNSVNNNGLCPSHYLSAPAISWDAMLNMIKVKLELIPDANMYIFFEKGTRSGVCDTYNRYSRAKKKYLKYYDTKKELKDIIYLDANNLYAYAMLKFLPPSGFKWIDPKEFYVNKYTSNSSKGCALQVDLEYPKELRELNNDYPLAPDKIEIKREMLFEYKRKIAGLYNIHICDVKKLVFNFLIKKNM